MRRLSLILLVLLLSGCAVPLTTEQARGTAVAGGCWPLYSEQPDTPIPAATVRPGTPTMSPAPTVLAYPSCTPQPGTPTVTRRPTRVPTPTPQPTPASAPPIAGTHEIGQPPGKNTNLRLAIGEHGQVAIAWTNWGWAPPNSGPDGQVFVRVLDDGNTWGLAQTVNREPVQGGAGGTGIAATISDTLVVAWGDGRGAIWSAESRDAAHSWSAPLRIGTFASQVLALHADSLGGLHLLALTPDPHHLRYAYRAPALSTSSGQAGAGWTTADLPFGGEHFGGDLAVLALPGGGVRRFVVARLEGSVGLLRSDDGRNWARIPIELGRFMAEPNPDKVAVMAATRPAGDLVAVAWSQYSAGGAFLQFSTDGGLNWSREERIAQHQKDGDCYASDGSGLSCGYYPSMAYDQATDSLAIAWVEIVRKREPPMRTLLAARRLSEADGWRFIVTPEQPIDSPVLTPWGWQGMLYGSRSGRASWLVLLDNLNDQNRVDARQLDLPAILGEAAS